MKKYFVLMALAVVLVGCIAYIPPENKNIKSEMTFNLSKDKVWERTMAFLMQYNLIPNTSDKPSGTLRIEGDISGFEGEKGDTWSGYHVIKPVLDCGLSGINHINSGSLIRQKKVIFILISDESNNSCKIKILIQWSSHNPLKTNNEICVSTGIFESELFEYINK